MRKISLRRLFLFVCGLALACCGWGCAAKRVMYKASVHKSVHVPSSARASAIASKNMARGLPLPPKVQAALPQGVEEADLLRRFGTRLWYLHNKRGLMLFQLKNPRKPRLEAVLPVYGTPVEMFVGTHRAYIFVNDVMQLKQASGRFSFHRVQSSQLVVVDVSRFRKPRILSSMNLPGRVREGATRKRGKHLFFVTHRKARGRRYDRRLRRYVAIRRAALRLHAVQVLPGGQLKERQRFSLLQEGHKSYALGLQKSRRCSRGAPFAMAFARRQRTLPVHRRPHGRAFRWEQRFTFTSTPHGLIIATQWNYTGLVRYGYLRRYVSGQRASHVSVWPFSSESNELLPPQRFWLRGVVGDQFKQTLLMRGRRLVYAGVSMENHWRRWGRRRWRHARNRLSIVSIASSHVPRLLSRIPFGKKFETVRGTAFDHKRQVLYAITALEKPPHEIIDPLYVISLRSLRHPKILSQIDGLSGDMNLFRLIEGGRFLMAVGRDTSGACRGFGRASGRNRTAVSLIDVRKLNNARLIQRKCFVFSGVRSVRSAVNQKLDQAHKMIGLHSDGYVNMVSVPLSFRVRQRVGRRWKWKWQTAVGLMEWDRAALQAKGADIRQNVLSYRGAMYHPEGHVRRTFLFRQTKRTWLVALSDAYLSVGWLDRFHRPVQATAVALQQMQTEAASTEASVFGQYLLTVRKVRNNGRWVHHFSLRLRKTKQTLASFSVKDLLHWRRRGQKLYCIVRAARRAEGQRMLVVRSRFAMRVASLGEKGVTWEKPVGWPTRFLVSLSKAMLASKGLGQMRWANMDGRFVVVRRVSERVQGVALRRWVLRWTNVSPKGYALIRERSLPQAASYRLLEAGKGRVLVQQLPGRTGEASLVQDWTWTSKGVVRGRWLPVAGRVLVAVGDDAGARLLVHVKQRRHLRVLAWKPGDMSWSIARTLSSDVRHIDTWRRGKGQLALSYQGHGRKYLAVVKLSGKAFRVVLKQRYWSPVRRLHWAQRRCLAIGSGDAVTWLAWKSPQQPRVVAFSPGAPRRDVSFVQQMAKRCSLE